MDAMKRNELQKIGGEHDLTNHDIEDFHEAERRIFRLMKDGKWRRASTIIKVSGQREGLRRLRALRSRGLEIEKRRDGRSRDFMYRIVKTTPR